LTATPQLGVEGLKNGVRSVWLRGSDGKVFRPTARQQEFFRAIHHYPRTSFIGGAGSGKTTAICAALILLMLQYPGTTWLLGRFNYRGLVTVTWRMLRQMLPKECVAYASDSAQNLTLVLKNGTILYGWNLQQWERFQGLNLAGAVIDEQTELKDRMIYDAVALRVRDPRGPRVIFGACMPNGKDWTWRMFFADPRPGFCGIRAKSTDNPHLPADYVPMLRQQYSPEMQARFIDAEFTSLSGLVLYAWDPNTHIVDPFEVPRHWPKFRALDPGYTVDPAACLFAATDELGNVFIFDEYYETGRVIREQAATIISRGYPHQFEWTVIDPSAARRTEDSGRSHVDLFAEAGLYCQEGPRSRRETGVEAVQGYLRPDPEHFHPITGHDNAPRLYVFRTCKNFIDEISGWTYDNRGKPREKNDHLMDALRYLILKRPHPASRPTRAPREEGWKAFWEGIADEASAPSLPFIGGHA
jgi:hypothetical protein